MEEETWQLTDLGTSKYLGKMAANFSNMLKEGFFDEAPECCCTTWIMNTTDEIIDEIIAIPETVEMEDEVSYNKADDFWQTIFIIENTKRNGTAKLTEAALNDFFGIYIVGAIMERMRRDGDVIVKDNTVPLGMVVAEKTKEFE